MYVKVPLTQEKGEFCELFFDEIPGSECITRICEIVDLKVHLVDPSKNFRLVELIHHFERGSSTYQQSPRHDCEQDEATTYFQLQL